MLLFIRSNLTEKISLTNPTGRSSGWFCSFANFAWTCCTFECNSSIPSVIIGPDRPLRKRTSPTVSHLFYGLEPYPCTLHLVVRRLAARMVLWLACPLTIPSLPLRRWYDPKSLAVCLLGKGEYPLRSSQTGCARVRSFAPIGSLYSCSRQSRRTHTTQLCTWTHTHTRTSGMPCVMTASFAPTECLDRLHWRYLSSAKSLWLKPACLFAWETSSGENVQHEKQ